MIPSQIKNQIQYSKIRNQKIAQVLLYWTMLLASLWFEMSKRVQMKVLILLLVASQLINASPTYTCDPEGFSKYLHFYPSKCGEDCEKYKE